MSAVRLRRSEPGYAGRAAFTNADNSCDGLPDADATPDDHAHHSSDFTACLTNFGSHCGEYTCSDTEHGAFRYNADTCCNHGTIAHRNPGTRVSFTGFRPRVTGAGPDPQPGTCAPGGDQEPHGRDRDGRGVLLVYCQI